MIELVSWLPVIIAGLSLLMVLEMLDYWVPRIWRRFK